MDRRAPGLRSAILLLFAAALPACLSAENEARDTFSHTHSCPKERLSVQRKQGLSAYELTFGPDPSPPPDVAADPGRLALWQSDRARARANWDKMTTIFEVSGCGVTALLRCHDARDSNGAETIACAELPRVTPPAR